MKTVTVNVPFEICCKRKPGKLDSFFYAGNNIARAKVLNRVYVLTTAGMYDFGLINGRKRNDTVDRYKLESYDLRRFRNIARNYRLTDKRIRRLTDDGALVANWGWFGINVWVDGKCLPTPTDAYSDYDEAMAAFKALIKADLEGK